MPIVYELSIYRPDVRIGPVGNYPDPIEFISTSPFPVPRVGDEIDRAFTFSDIATQKFEPCRVSRVKHGVRHQPAGTITYTLRVWTEATDAPPTGDAAPSP